MNQDGSRPFIVTMLAILAGLAAVIGFIHMLQMLHLFPLFLGNVQFFTFDALGAFGWLLLTLLAIWVARLLWNLDARGWLLMVFLSSLLIVVAVLSTAGGSTLGSMGPAMIIGGLILLLMVLPGTREAFLGARWD